VSDRNPAQSPAQSAAPGAEQPTDPEDRKIITLARSARARTGASEGACVRDSDGRTYAGCSVELAHLRLSALEVAIAMAVSSGAPGLEAVAISRDQSPTEQDAALIGDLPGSAVTVWHVDVRGAVIGRDVVEGATR
jgi:hypothetical protein